MSKPHTAEELAAFYLEDMAASFGLTKDEFLRQWNCGARYADEHWADQPHERGPGTTYEHVQRGATRTAGGGVSQDTEQQEKTRQR